jgi:hypothetical protein
VQFFIKNVYGSMQHDIRLINIFKRSISFAGKFIDFKVAMAGAVIMGLIVGVINRDFGFWPAMTAALKQAAYTFLFGGMITKLLYFIAGKIPGIFASAIISSLVVTFITVCLVFVVHSMKGTPLPLESTLPTAVLAPFGFAFLAYRRKKVDSR